MATTASWQGRGPCRAEAPDLQALHREFATQGVEFLGVNIRDNKAQAQAFERNVNLGCPGTPATNTPATNTPDTNGLVLMAWSTSVPRRSAATTRVPDRNRRWSAKIFGIADKGTLRAPIANVLAEAWRHRTRHGFPNAGHATRSQEGRLQSRAAFFAINTKYY